MAGTGRLSSRAVLVLMSVAGGEKHPYAITKDIESFAAITLGSGTLYAALERLEQAELIERLADEARRHPYRMTVRGRVVLGEELAEATRLASLGLMRLAAARPRA